MQFSPLKNLSAPCEVTGRMQNVTRSLILKIEILHHIHNNVDKHVEGSGLKLTINVFFGFPFGV